MLRSPFLAAVILVLAAHGQAGVIAGASDSPPADPVDKPASVELTNRPTEVSPTALVATADGKRLFIACATANQVAVFDTAAARIIGRIDVPESPLGLARSKDGSRLYVACAAPSSTICVIDPVQGRIVERIPAGHTSMAPVLSPDDQTLYVCNRFNNDISVIDLAARREARRIRVEREPVAAAITPDGRYLVVANHLHTGPANHMRVEAEVSVIDTTAGRVAKAIHLTEGAGLLRGVAVSPDGRFAAVTFIRARYWLSTTGVEMGRINCNALAVLDMNRLELLGILLLDQTAYGAANPWAVAWTPDGKTIVVSYAGTHEVSFIDAPVDADSATFFSLRYGVAGGNASDGPPRTRHPVRVRKRLPLPGNGPRALAVAGARLYVANYFSDNLCRIDLTASEPRAEALPLGPDREPSLIRKGEMLFNDAGLCFQEWQSCASCHDADGRADGLNWDLRNDGVGNPKNTKALLWSHQTAPVMALGVRASAEVAVRAGLHHILFSQQPEEVPAAIDAYLASLRPVPSPYLVNGQLSAAAERGKQLFMSAGTGCAVCHPPPMFTDFAAYDVGTAHERFSGLWERPAEDKQSDRFDTTVLVELWRSAPYLHDGSAATLREMLTTQNRSDLHGRTSHLTEQAIDELVEYLLSL